MRYARTHGRLDVVRLSFLFWGILVVSLFTIKVSWQQPRPTQSLYNSNVFSWIFIAGFSTDNGFVAKGMSRLISTMSMGYVNTQNDNISTKRKRSTLSIKDKQVIISCLDNGGKKDKFSSWILQPWYMQEQRQDPEIHRQQSKVAEACLKKTQNPFSDLRIQSWIMTHP